MPTLAVTNETLQEEVGRLLNWGLVAEWTEEDLKDYGYIKNAALRQFYYPSVTLTQGDPHTWSFLTPLFTLTTDTPYATGTVTVASGVVTLVGGTFPSWAADGEIDLAGQTDGPFEISTRDSTTQVTLVDTSVTVASAVNFTVSRYRYDFPANYGGQIGPMTFRTADLSYATREVEFTTFEQLRIKRQNWTGNRSYPRGAAETLQRVQYEGAVNTDYTELTTRELWLWPTPDTTYHLSMRYVINPQTLDPDEILGADLYPNAVRDLVLAEAERKMDHPTPKYIERSMDSLLQAIKTDQARYMPDGAGYMGDRSDRAMYSDPDHYHRTESVSHENDA